MSEHPKHPDPRTATWRAPEVLADQGGADVPGAMGGSRLFEQPQYRAELAAFLAFLEPAGPVAVEVGFDFGRRLVSLAQADARVRWVGMEVRERRVLEVAERAPANLLPWRVDARIVFRGLVPAGRLARVDVLFPTPWWSERHRAKRLLLTPAFVADVGRSLMPGGVLHVATDVGPYFEHVAGLFAGWRRVEDPPLSPVASRREHVCRRDGIEVWRGTWTPELG